MKLIVGLGNVGERFNNTRHNIGFDFIDFFCNFMDFKLYDFKNGFDGVFLKKDDFIIFKPYTFMNFSGVAIKKIVNFYKIDVNDILIIYDDIYLQLGKIRLRESGDSGGHNGIKNIIDNLGTKNFKRIKIGTEFLGGNLSDFVLEKFNDKEQKKIIETFKLVSKIVSYYIKFNFSKALNFFSSINNVCKK